MLMQVIKETFLGLLITVAILIVKWKFGMFGDKNVLEYLLRKIFCPEKK